MTAGASDLCAGCQLPLPMSGVVFRHEGEDFHVSCGAARGLGDAAAVFAEHGAKTLADSIAATVRDAAERRRARPAKPTGWRRR